jgi:hypothetical protein
MVPKNRRSRFPIWRTSSPSWSATNADRYRGENGHCEKLVAAQRKSKGISDVEKSN